VLYGAAAIPAWCGVVFEQQVKELTTGVVMRAVTYVESGRIRTEVLTPTGSVTAITIFRSDRPVVWMLQPAEKTYQELTPADVERMAGQMSSMQRQMEEMLKNLPPDQRAAAEQMMKQQMGAGQRPTVTVKRIGPESVGSFTATKYEIWAGDERLGEIWAAPQEQLQLQPAEYDTLLQFARFFEKLSQAAANELDVADVLARYADSIQGFPVKVRTYANGELVSEQETVRAERHTAGEDKFQLPPGLRKVQPGGPEP